MLDIVPPPFAMMFPARKQFHKKQWILESTKVAKSCILLQEINQSIY